MRRIAITTLAILLTSPFALAQELTPIVPPGQKKQAELSSRYLGYSMGMELGRQGFTAEDVRQAEFIKGFLTALAGDDLAVKQPEVQAAMEALGAKIQMRLQKAAADNEKAASRFLESNQAKDGVQATESGLQYKVITSGSGAKPTAADTVRVHYEGKLLSGKVFDSSIARGEPAEFPVTGVIPGWTEALMRMRVGDKWQLFIPPALAYGQGGSLPRIGPNSLLTFEIELIEIKK